MSLNTLKSIFTFTDLVRMAEIPEEKISNNNLLDSFYNPYSQTAWFAQGWFWWYISSLEYDINQESQVARYFQRIFQQNTEFYEEPLVVSIDDFFNDDGRWDFSICNKVLKLNNKDRKEKKKSCPILLWWISESQLFTSDIINKLPSQDIVDKNPLFIEFKELLERMLSIYTFHDLTAILDILTEWWDDSDNAKKVAAKIVLATFILSHDSNGWQNLWYEWHSSPNNWLIIIAPLSFHQAKNRLNKFWWHWGHDYSIRRTLPVMSYPFFSSNTEPLDFRYEGEGEYDRHNFDLALIGVISRLRVWLCQDTATQIG